jgi:hypothetical protein
MSQEHQPQSQPAEPPSSESVAAAILEALQVMPKADLYLLRAAQAAT